MTDHLPYKLMWTPGGHQVLHKTAEHCAEATEHHLPVYLDDGAASEVILNGTARTCALCFELDDPPPDIW